MAEVTAMRHNALPYPIYGAPWTATFPMLDADGDLVTGATTPDAEVSLNGGTFADCTNESTEIATNSGMYYLTLTGAEMTADVVTVIAKSATAGMKTTSLTFYPRKLVSIRTGTSASGGSLTSSIVLDGSASAIDDFYNGMVCVAVIDTLTEVRMISDYTGSTQTATVIPDWNVAPDNNDTFTIYRPDGVQMQQSNVTHINSTAQTARDIGASVLLSTGTGTGQLDFTSGVVKSNEVQILGTAVSTPATAGILDVNLKNIANATVSTSTAQLGVNVVNNAGSAITSVSGVQEVKVQSIAANAITATSINADAITDAKVASDVTIASVTGSVGSVATGGITAASIAADAIGASELAADAVTEIVAGVWGASQSTYNASGTFGQAMYIKRSNTAQAGAATTITLDASASSTDDFYNNDLLVITAGTGAGQARFVSDYVGSTKVVTVLDAWFTNPDNTSVFIIQPFPPSDVTSSLSSITSSLSTINTNVSSLSTDLDTLSDDVAAVDAVADAIKVKTDSLTYTVSGQVDANIQYVNDVVVTGVGTSGSEWGAS